jgi:hypothetical protein
MSESYRKIYTDDKYVNNFSASNINATDTLIADNIVSNNIVGPFGPIGGLVSYSVATFEFLNFPAEGVFKDKNINYISNPNGSTLASNFTVGSIFEAYYSGQLKIVDEDVFKGPIRLQIGLTFDIGNVIPTVKTFGNTTVTNQIDTNDVQSYEYRCTFRVVSYINDKITLTFNTSAQIVTDKEGLVLSGVNQASGISDEISITVGDGNINLVFYVVNLSDTVKMDFYRYTSYIKKIV